MSSQAGPAGAAAASAAATSSSGTGPSATAAPYHAAGAGASANSPADTAITAGTPGEDDHDDSNEDEDDDDDEIVIVNSDGNDGMDVDGGGGDASSSSAPGAGGSQHAPATIAAATAVAVKLKDFNDLPQELMIQILLKLEPKDLPVAARVNKRVNEITRNLAFRVSYFTRSFDRSDILYSALQRPKLATPEMLQRLLDNGAHFSRYLAQMVVRSFNSDRVNRHSSMCRTFSSTMPFSTYSLIVGEAAKRYGNDMDISRNSDDAEMLMRHLTSFRRSKSETDWKQIEELFVKYNFMFYTRHDYHRMEFVHQIASEPRLAPLATQNGLIVSEVDCDTIMKNVFSDSVKNAEEKANSLSTFILSGLPGLHVPKKLAIDAMMHLTSDASDMNWNGSTNRRSSSYGAIKILADKGKLNFNLSREIAKLLLTKRFSRSCLPKLPHLNILLEDFPEIVPIIPRKVALIKFLTHHDYSTDAARQKLHDGLAEVRPYLTQQLLVDVVADPFMPSALPLQYARDFLPDDKVDAEVAAYEALRKCMWHPCKGATILALYEFVSDKEYFKGMLLDELRRWRFDLDSIPPDDPDDTSPAAVKKRVASLLAWDYEHIMMGGEFTSDASIADQYELRRIGKFFDFLGEYIDDEAQPATTSGQDSNTALAAGVASGISGAAASGGAGGDGDGLQAAAGEEVLKELPLPDKNPYINSYPWNEDNLLYGSLHTSAYNKGYAYSQAYSPLAFPIGDAVMELFGPASEAADIVYAHALINGNDLLIDAYHQRMYYPCLMHLRLLMHTGRRIMSKVMTRFEQAPFRKRGFGASDDGVLGETRLESPVWCSTDAHPLTARPGAAELTLDLETGDDYYPLGLNESDDEEMASWRRPKGVGKKAGIKEDGDASASYYAAASPSKRGRKRAASKAPSVTAGSSTGAAAVANADSASTTAVGTPAADGSIANGGEDPANADASVQSAATPGGTAFEDKDGDVSMATAAGDVSAEVNAGIAADASATVETAATSGASGPADSTADASVDSKALNARGRPKRKAAADVSYFDDEEISSEDFVDPEETKAHIREVQALTGVGPVKRGRGRPRKYPLPTTIVHIPPKPRKSKAKGKGAQGGGAAGKKRKAAEALEGGEVYPGQYNDEDPNDFSLVAPQDDGIKPVIPRPAFVGPMALSSVAATDIWAITVEFPVMWKWATYERHIRAAQATEAWLRHISLLQWSEQRKHKTRKDDARAEALKKNIPVYRLRVSKTEAHKSLDMLQRNLEMTAATMIRELEMQRSQFLATVKDADAEVAKIARQRRALVNRIRTQRRQAAERALAALAPPSPPPPPAAEGPVEEAAAADEAAVEGTIAMDVDAREAAAAAAGDAPEGEESAAVEDAVDAAAAETPSPARGKGKGRAKGKGKEKEKASASPKGKGKAKAVTSEASAAATAPKPGPAAASSKGKGKAKAAEPPSQVGEPGDWDEDEDDAGFASDGSGASATSFDSAVDASGKSKRKETGKTGDEMLRDPTATSRNSTMMSRYGGGGGGSSSGAGGGSSGLHDALGSLAASAAASGSQSQAILAAATIASAALLYGSEDEDDVMYPYGVYSDEDSDEFGYYSDDYDFY